MLIALLKGKLSALQRNMEDLLTSNVFGLLQHYQEKLALLPFIREARTLEGRQPLSDPEVVNDCETPTRRIYCSASAPAGAWLAG